MNETPTPDPFRLFVIWFCLSCYTCGFVEYEKEEGAYQTSVKIREDHVFHSMRTKVGTCSADPRVLNDAINSSTIVKESTVLPNGIRGAYRKPDD
jgi:hypothetical protein